jgi:XRE family transcriptional regulator, regulator of sulfur utilization
MKSESKKLGKNLTRIRKEKGISQEKLSHLLHIDRSFVSNIENGKTNPTLATIAKLAKAVSVPVNELLK